MVIGGGGSIIMRWAIGIRLRGEQVGASFGGMVGQYHKSLGPFQTFPCHHGHFNITHALKKRKQQILIFVGQALARQYSNLLLIFLLAQSAPLFLQVCMERSIFAACARIFKQIVTLAPLHFIFQAKIVGEYVSNEIVQGGAKYCQRGAVFLQTGVPSLAKLVASTMTMQPWRSTTVPGCWQQSCLWSLRSQPCPTPMQS